MKMAMARLDSTISSSSPPTLARQADNSERREKTKAQVPSELGLYFFGTYPPNPRYSLRVVVGSACAYEEGAGDAKDTAEWER